MNKTIKQQPWIPKNPAEQFLKDKGFEHPIKLSSDTTTEYSLSELLEQYHEARMKEELIEFSIRWNRTKYFSHITIEEIDDYLASRKNK